jgi:hypothetical protein
VPSKIAASFYIICLKMLIFLVSLLSSLVPISAPVQDLEGQLAHPQTTFLPSDSMMLSMEKVGEVTWTGHITILGGHGSLLLSRDLFRLRHP